MKCKKLLAGLMAFLLLCSSTLEASAENSFHTFTKFRDHFWFEGTSSRLDGTVTLTDAHRSTLLASLSNTEKKAVRGFLDKAWRDSNYGMPLLSALSCYDLVTYGDYASLYEWGSGEEGITDEIKSIIHYHQALQYTDEIRQSAANLVYGTTDAERLQYLISCVEDGSPTMFAFSSSTKYDNRQYGMAYKVEYKAYEIDDRTFDGRIVLTNGTYSPIGTDVREDCLYFNTADWSWYIPRMTEGTHEGDILTLVTEDISLMNHGGLFGGTDAYVSEQPFVDVLTSNALNSAYTLHVINYADGTWTQSADSMAHCKETNGFYGDMVDNEQKNFLLPGEERGYVLELETAQELETAMYFENSIQYSYTEAGTLSVTEPSGYLEISGTGGAYKLEMVFNEGHYSGSWYDIAVSGSAGTASLRKAEGGYILTADNLKDVSVETSGISETAKMTFSADVQSVLLYEIDAETIGAAADMDGDGTYETTVASTGNDGSYGRFVRGEDDWRFRNQTAMFGNTYVFTESDRAILEEKLTNAEMRLASSLIDYKFLGSCYGMAATSILACYDLIDYGVYRTYDLDFRQGPAYSLYDMTLEGVDGYSTPSTEIKSLINYYAALQFTDAHRQHTARSMLHMTEAERIQSLIDAAESGTPALVAFFGSMGYDEDGYRNGHAVVAYDAEYGSYEVNRYGGEWGEEIIETMQMDVRISVYDNAALEPAYAQYIFFNTSDGSWYYPYYRAGSADGGQITSVITDPALLNADGLLAGTEYTENEDFLAIFSTDGLYSDHSLEKIHYDGTSWEKTGEGDADISGFPSFYGDTMLTKAMHYILTDDESGYVLETEETETLDLYLNYENCLLFAEHAAGSQAVFHPSGYLETTGTSGDYQLEAVYNDGYYDGSWHTFSVDGIAASASLQRTSEGWVLTSDNLQLVSVYARGGTDEARLTFSANAESVLLYEIDAATIGVSMDTDGDGTYETPVPETELPETGDVNFDGSIDANDAADVLAAAAAAGAGEDTALHPYQETAADVNGDGIIDANDASLILVHAARNAVSSEVTWEELLLNAAETDE